MRVAGRVAQSVLEGGIHHDRDAHDRADVSFELEAVRVTDCLVLLAREQVEPVVEHAAGHDGPLFAREADLGGTAVCLTLRATDDPLLRVLHPLLVDRIAGVLAAVHPVVAGDCVELTVLPIAEDFFPLDAEAPADRLGRMVVAAGRTLVLDRVVERVGEAATLEVSDVEARAHGASVLSSSNVHDFDGFVNVSIQKSAVFRLILAKGQIAVSAHRAFRLRASAARHLCRVENFANPTPYTWPRSCRGGLLVLV